MRQIFRFELLLVFSFWIPAAAFSQDDANHNSPRVTMTMLSGETVKGNLKKLSEGSVTLSAAEQSDNQTGKQFATADIEQLSFESKPDGSATTNQVLRLVDGSLLSATSVTITEQKASIELAGGAKNGGEPIEISTRDISWIRTELSSSVDSKWKSATEKTVASDTLFMLRDGELETLEGVIQAVGEERLSFKYDDEVIEAKRSRISGLSFYHAAGRELPSATNLCRDRFGSTFMATKVELDSETRIKLELASGSQIELPVASLAEIDFTVGKVFHLSELEVEGEQWSPQIDAAELQKPLSKLMKWNTNRNLNNKPLKLFSASGFQDSSDVFVRNEKEFTRGIAMRSGTKLVYRLPEGYKKISGLCGIDPDMRPLGNVTLKFSSDGKTLWSREISGNADEPVAVEFDVDKISRLLLHVDYGKHSDVADHLNICNLRLLK